MTLFIDVSHFEATIMVTLTSMLVMYTLYQSISATLPQTSYLKMIDIWLLSGLIIPFIIFIVLAIIDVLILQESVTDPAAHNSSSTIKIFISRQNGVLEKSMSRHQNSRAMKLLKICRIVIPMTTFILCMVFWSIVIYIYHH